MAIYPQNYIQIVDIEIKQQYSSSKNIPDSVFVPIHTNGEIVPQNPELCIIEAEISFDSENVFINLPYAESEGWIYSVFKNICYYLNRVYDVVIKEDDYDIDFKYGIPHPCLTLELITDILKITPTEPQIEGVDNKILKYSLSSGFIYIDFNNDTIKLVPFEKSTDSMLMSELNTQLTKDLGDELKHLNMKIFNPHSNIFHISILYPAFLINKKKTIKFWNTIANDIFNRDFINEPTPRLRLLCKSLNCAGSEASLIWLELASTLDYEIPIIGNTIPYISSLTMESVNKNYISWNGWLNKFDELYSQLQNVTNYDLGYDKNIIPDSKMIKLHANKEHQILAAEPIIYGPVVPLSNKNISNIDEYFWSENGWWLKIKGARPCDKLDKDFKYDEIKKYWENKNKYILANKCNLESATSITDDELNKSMILLDDD